METIEQRVRSALGNTLSADTPLKISQFDWEEVGVSHKYIIAITARSGSTWLAHLLKSTNICGNPQEIFNAEAIRFPPNMSGATDFRRVFEHQVTSNTLDHTFGFEVNFEKFNQLLELASLQGVFLDNKFKFVYLTRRDLLSQAISVMSAMKTGVWHKFIGRVTNKDTQCDHIDERAIWHWILSFLQEERRWETFFNRNNLTPLRLTYEDLVTNPALQVARIISYLRPDQVRSTEDVQRHITALKNGTEKLTRSASENIWIDFRLKFGAELEEIDRLRTGIDGTEFAIEIGRKYGIAITIAP